MVQLSPSQPGSQTHSKALVAIELLVVESTQSCIAHGEIPLIVVRGGIFTSSLPSSRVEGAAHAVGEAVLEAILAREVVLEDEVVGAAVKLAVQAKYGGEDAEPPVRELADCLVGA